MALNDGLFSYLSKPGAPIHAQDHLLVKVNEQQHGRHPFGRFHRGSDRATKKTRTAAVCLARLHHSLNNTRIVKERLVMSWIITT